MSRVPAPSCSKSLAIPLLALALVLAAMLTPAVPAEPTQADRFMAACMAAEQNQSYCQCTTDIFLQGLTPEELSMFLSYLETENEQDSAFLEAMLPQEKLGRLFEQADATCYGGQPPVNNQMQGNAEQRMIKQCLDAGDDPAYCQCAVDRISQQLSDQEMELAASYMEENDPAKADQYLAQLDADKVDRIFSEADMFCNSQTQAQTDYTPTGGDAVERFIKACVADGEDPATCRCFAEHFAQQASPEEIHMILDALEAEEAGDFDKSEWIYNQMDQQKLEAAFDYAGQACNIDM